MTESNSRASLEETTQRAAAQLAEMAGDGGNAGPGELFVMPQTADFPIEWLIVSEDGEPPRRFLQLPADTHPILGPHDIRIPEGAPGGPLVLRCSHGVWTDSLMVRAEYRTGSVDPIYVERARRAWERATRDPGTRAGDAGVDPDYEDWVEDVLLPATAALESANRAPSATGAPRANATVLSAARMKHYALAASMLLAVGFLAGKLYEGAGSESSTAIIEQTQRRLDALHADIARAEAEHRAELAGLQQELESADHRRVNEVQALEERLAQARRTEPLVNAPFAWLAPVERTRGQVVEPLSIPPDAEWIFVVLEVRDPSAYDQYQLEIRDGGGRIVWSHRALIKSGSVELPLVLPSASFPPGEYQFALLGVAAESTTPLARYELRIAQPPR